MFWLRNKKTIFSLHTKVLSMKIREKNYILELISKRVCKILNKYETVFKQKRVNLPFTNTVSGHLSLFLSGQCFIVSVVGLMSHPTIFQTFQDSNSTYQTALWQSLIG